MEKQFSIIAASTTDYGIGKNNKIPWKISEDMKFFQKLTLTTENPGMKNCCIMGRKTYFSIPPKFRPLQGRVNIILTKDPAFVKRNLANENDVFIFTSLDEALRFIQTDERLKKTIEEVYVIGGGQVYREAILHKNCARIFLTWILGALDRNQNLNRNAFECDTFFPAIPEDIYGIQEPMDRTPVHYENEIAFQYLRYDRIKVENNHGERKCDYNGNQFMNDIDSIITLQKNRVNSHSNTMSSILSKLKLKKEELEAFNIEDDLYAEDEEDEEEMAV